MTDHLKDLIVNLFGESPVTTTIVTLIIAYYVHNYFLVFTAILTLAPALVGSFLRKAADHITWDEGPEAAFTAKNLIFFVAGALMWIVEVWLFSIFLEYYAVGESELPVPFLEDYVIPLHLLMALGLGLASLISGHSAHGCVEWRLKETTTAKHFWATVLAWVLGVIFVGLSVSLCIAAGFRSNEFASRLLDRQAARVLIVGISAFFALVVPLVSLLGLSRGYFLFQILKNFGLAIPAFIGMTLWILATLCFYLLGLALSLMKLPLEKLFQIIAGFAGLKDVQTAHENVGGWRIGLAQLIRMGPLDSFSEGLIVKARNKMHF